MSEAATLDRRLLGALALATTLAPLGSTSLAVALPSISGDLGVGLASTTQWLVTSYLLVNIVCQSPGGKLGDLIGYRRALALGQSLVAVGTLCALVAPHLAVLVVARVLVAAGGAAVGPSAMALARNNLPAERHARAFATFGALMGLAAAVGPPLGGALTRVFGWRAVFAPNLVILALPEVEREESVGNSRVLRQPVGVVAAVTPWNYPLHQVVAKVAPALAAGCTIVVKPSELCPLSTFLFAEVVAESGLPPGVFQLVNGSGPEVGEALATHPEVDLVSFTGSTRAGRRVAELAGTGLKRVKLELGGKSPCVVLDDADLTRAVPACVASAFQNSGQTCSALTRLLVPRARLAEATELAVAAARGFRTGDPLDPTTRLGPLVSLAQRERVRGFISRALAAGQQLALGGVEAPAGLEHGAWVAPTVFTDVSPTSELAREEVFGPVLALLGHDGDEHALALANDTPYGLAAAVWSADPARAERLARRLRAGQVDLNGAKWNLLAPFGGFKASGWGRELGRHGLAEYTELQSLQG